MIKQLALALALVSSLTVTVAVADPAKSAAPAGTEPGQLRGTVHGDGDVLIPNATVTVMPGAHTLKTGPDGAFQIDLAPGKYEMTIVAPKLATSHVDVTVDPNGVSIKNIFLKH